MAKDELSMKKILDASSPAECKSIGYGIKLDRTIWNQTDTKIMAKALNEKFTQNPELKKYLMNTGELILAEASASDRFWGTGIGLGKADTTKEPKWRGKNTLGKLLMQLRQQFS